jgi:hypothetical protein
VHFDQHIGAADIALNSVGDQPFDCGQHSRSRKSPRAATHCDRGADNLMKNLSSFQLSFPSSLMLCRGGCSRLLAIALNVS